MDYRAYGIVMAVFSILGLILSLVLAGVAVMAAISCSRRKLAPKAAWILFISFLVSFILEIGYMITSHGLTRLFGHGVTQWVYVFLGFVNLLAGLLLIAAFAMFRAQKPEAVEAGKEVAHG